MWSSDRYLSVFSPLEQPVIIARDGCQALSRHILPRFAQSGIPRSLDSRRMGCEFYPRVTYTGVLDERSRIAKAIRMFFLIFPPVLAGNEIASRSNATTSDKSESFKLCVIS